jgi:hypothetical protein
MAVRFAAVLGVAMLSAGIASTASASATPSVHSHPFFAFISETGTINLSNPGVTPCTLSQQGPAVGIPIGRGTITSTQADACQGSPFVEYLTAADGSRLYDSFPDNVQFLPTGPCPATLHGLPLNAYNTADGLFTSGTGRFANTSNAPDSLHLKACIYLGAPNSSGIAELDSVGTYYGTVSY